MTSLSGMKEKFLIIFEATTAHSCFSALPSSSKLNRESSSNHNSERRDFVMPLCCLDSELVGPEIWLQLEHYPAFRSIFFFLFAPQRAYYKIKTGNTNSLRYNRTKTITLVYHLSPMYHIRSQIQLQLNLHLMF